MDALKGIRLAMQRSNRADLILVNRRINRCRRSLAYELEHRKRNQLFHRLQRAIEIRNHLLALVETKAAFVNHAGYCRLERGLPENARESRREKEVQVRRRSDVPAAFLGRPQHLRLRRRRL